MSTKEVKRELGRRSESADLDSDPSVACYSSEFENVIQDRYGFQEAPRPPRKERGQLDHDDASPKQVRANGVGAQILPR